MAERFSVIDNRKSKGKTAKATWFDKTFEKIKKVKNLHIVLSVVAVALIGLLFFSFDSGTRNDKTTLSESEYFQIENRLCDVLSKINGAGNVSVMINFAGTSELITATTSDVSQDKTSDYDSSGNRVTESKTESISPVIIRKDGEDTPLIVKEILPDIVGVVVVAEGADRLSVKLNLLQAVQTLLDVSADKVEIFSMKKFCSVFFR